MATYSNKRKAEVLQPLEEKRTAHHQPACQRSRHQQIYYPGVDEAGRNGEKFCIVLESFSLNKVELSEYAPKKGLFVSEIQAWKKNCFLRTIWM